MRATVLRVGALLLCVSLLGLVTPQLADSGIVLASVALTVVAAALVVSATLVASRAPRSAMRPPLVGEARRLRGSFRRQSAPDTPGRPRPRAPGNTPTA